MGTHEQDPSEQPPVSMGVSSERVGPTAHGEVGTDGLRDTTAGEPEGDTPPEQSVGGEDPHPDPPVPPVSGYNSHDPRAADHPYDAPPQV